MAIKDKVVVITGGAMGIGRYTARLFAAAGAKLAVADYASMENVASDVAEVGGSMLPVHVDLRDEDQVRDMMKRVHDEFGRIDVLINDAGIVTHFQAGSPRWPKIRDMDASFFENVMRTNLIGTFHCMKHVIPYMEEQGGGHIINFGQGSVRNDRVPDSIGAAVYHTSKISIRALTKSVAEEERDHNICIVSLGPGGGGGAIEGRRGIATDETPEENRGKMNWVADVVGDRYILAAEAPMELSGNQLTMKNGELVLIED
jgi:NAD(P)-dependent dehydrogenase (short-subunit alcohol dehydrogenase family)